MISSRLTRSRPRIDSTRGIAMTQQVRMISDAGLSISRALAASQVLKGSSHLNVMDESSAIAVALRGFVGGWGGGGPQIGAHHPARYPERRLVAGDSVSRDARGLAVLPNQRLPAPSLFSQGVKRQAVFSAVGFECVHGDTVYTLKQGSQQESSPVETQPVGMGAMDQRKTWDAIVAEIQRRRDTGETLVSIGNRFGRSKAYVHKVLSGAVTGERVNMDNVNAMIRGLGLKPEQDENESSVDFISGFGLVRKVKARLGAGAPDLAGIHSVSPYESNTHFYA